MENMEYLKTLTVLYAEDEPETRSELKKFLSRRVANVITAADGTTALEKLGRTEPDIVVADLIMPGMDGMEMIREIRKRYPACRIIITSTVSEMQTVLDSVDVGIVKYILKPIEPQQLEEALLKCAGELKQRRPVSDVIRPEERKLWETHIKKEFSAVIKKAAGKGPRDVAAFFHEKRVEIIVYDAFTVMEHMLLEERGNAVLVEQCRRSFYIMIRDSLVKILADATGERYRPAASEINTRACSDWLCFEKI